MPLWPKRKPRPEVDEYGRTALWRAAFAGDVARLQHELANGEDANRGDDAGYTPLHVAVQQKHEAVIAALIPAGAYPSATDKHGNSPLWTAVLSTRGDYAIVETLLAAGADPDHLNNAGRSPRSVAMEIGRGLDTIFEQYN